MFAIRFEMTRKALEAEQAGRFRLPLSNVLDYRPQGRQRSLSLDGDRESAEIIEQYLEGFGCQVDIEPGEQQEQNDQSGDSGLPDKKSHRPHGPEKPPGRLRDAV